MTDGFKVVGRRNGGGAAPSFSTARSCYDARTRPRSSREFATWPGSRVIPASGPNLVLPAIAAALELETGPVRDSRLDSRTHAGIGARRIPRLRMDETPLRAPDQGFPAAAIFQRNGGCKPVVRKIRP